MINPSHSVKNRINHSVGYVLMVIMALMVINVTWQVLSRYILMSPSSFTDELARFLLIWLGMLGAAYVAGHNEHLAIDILPSKLSGKPKMRLMVFIHLIIICFAVPVMIFGGCNLVYITYMLGQKSTTLQIPLAYVYTVIPISGILIFAYQIADIKLLLSRNPKS
ncbi:C4-dicarboxylate ABC transporter permease [Echinicola pacifica]|uniref:C4-dicarboxylate ABC transporter permease n=1 Tax=Echinicola pacifica TaxID=346377 RepID=A0A918PQ20_9BACT|nr:TRAP transporter small permease [Echinicola pacifica]GGZ16464.1 C4-dicarboxylate ABC transporter permease [Echinicola pacifica]